PYPADKLDHVAVPDFASGAMENLGLVTYRENALLADDAASQLERQRVASVIAHETAHMWFGDLVTMRWWEGIWLNEAFASFMELLVTDDFEPSWQVWTNFGLDRAAALATDSLRSTRPIEYPVGRPEEADDMFDVITYDKGAAVLRMIERHLGDEVFRRGLASYLERHRFSNTSTTDLWDALEEVSGQPVRATMGTWVDQPGHPLVSVELTGPRQLKVSQQRFLLDGGVVEGQRWSVPVTLRWGGPDGTVEREKLLLDEASATLELKAEPSWALVNEGAWGVYRAHYSDDLRRRLFASLGQLDEGERLGLVTDTWAATVAGLVPLSASFELWGRLVDESDPDVWEAVARGLALLDLTCEEEVRPLVRQLAGHLAGGQFARVGWGGGAGSGPGGGPAPDGRRQARLRARLVTVLGTVGADTAVRQGARRLLEAAGTREAPLPPDLATAIAQVVAAAGGEREWQLLYSRYKQAATPQDEVRYLYSLGGFADPDLLGRSLELSFSDEVRSQDAPYLLRGILAQREGAAPAWEAVEAHWDEIHERWPGNTVPRMLGALPGLAAAGEAMAARANAWLDGHPVARGERKVRQARERLAVDL
ncbi:MAG: M1 family metallopeptidase, partial [Acidimicrobiales bacterium]